MTIFAEDELYTTKYEYEQIYEKVVNAADWSSHADFFLRM